MSAAKRHMARIAKMPCALCARLGLQQEGRTCVHHIREGQGMGQRATDYLTIPLCHACHQGDEGIHGNRALLQVARCTELDLLADVIKELSC